MASHPHVHVEGQSESSLHAVVVGPTQVFHETEKQYCVPPSQMFGGGIGGIGHAAGAAVAYEGIEKFAPGAHLIWPYPPAPEHVKPGPQSVSAEQGASHAGTHWLEVHDIGPPSRGVTPIVVAEPTSQRVPGPAVRSRWCSQLRQTRRAVARIMPERAVAGAGARAGARFAGRRDGAP